MLEYLLNSHAQGYSLSPGDLAYCLVTGFSGYPYAKRHFELAQMLPQDLGFYHKVIGAIEYIPLIGGVAALAERIVSFVSTYFFTPFAPLSLEKMFRHNFWQFRNLSKEQREWKMQKNADKALEEHKRQDPAAPYATAQEAAIVRFQPALPYRPLQVQASAFSNQGARPVMEDSHFYYSSDRFVFSGIFDGHGGAEAARFATVRLPQILVDILIAQRDGYQHYDIHQAYELAIEQFEREVAAREDLLSEGATATIVLIDKATRMAFTANLGDSEAKLYASINHQNKVIPMSCVRNWSSKYDCKRVSIASYNPLIEQAWRDYHNPKQLYLDVRTPLRVSSINVSRSLGDRWAKVVSEIPCVSHKPKISMQRLPNPETNGRPSVIVLACDGLWDFADESALNHLVSHHPNPSDLAEQIGRKALVDWRSTDNVSVLALTIT